MTQGREFFRNKGRMTLLHSVIFWFFLKASSCQLRYAAGTLDDSKFSINMTEHITAEYGECLTIPYVLTFPASTVTIPYKKYWFKGDPSETISETVVSVASSESDNALFIDGLPTGEYEYGFKLEWGNSKTYIFPKRVHITVSASTKKTLVLLNPMKVGEVAELTCLTPPWCFPTPYIHWRWTKTDGESKELYGRYDSPGSSHRISNTIFISPTADHHNTNITCVVEHIYGITETTVNMTVKFPPKILYGSQCFLKGKLLVCVCISRGNPLSPITWSLADLTDYSVTSSSSIQTVNSTVTMPAADYHNTTVRCVSSNELGRAQIEIPLQNDTENTGQNSVSTDEMKSKSTAVGPWIIVGLSLSLNLVLLAAFIIYIYKGRKSQQEKSHEENNTYATLNMADVGELYSAIPSQNK